MAIIGRAVLLGLAGIAALWSGHTIWDRLQTGADLAAVSTRILEDRSFNIQRLAAIKSHTMDNCAHAFPRAIIQLRLYEQATLRENELSVQKERESLDEDTKTLARCDPNGAFFPLVTAAFALSEGRHDEFFMAIRQSYRSAPFENWIALRRSPYMLTHYEDLPQDLQKAVQAEFVNLVNSGLHSEAADIFDESSLGVQAAMLAALQTGAQPSLHRAFLTRLIERRSGPRPRFKRSHGLIKNFSLPSGTSRQRSE